MAPSSQVTGNGSLLLQPLTKGHQGAWECSVSNRVASVSATTLVLVLGEGGGWGLKGPYYTTRCECD